MEAATRLQRASASRDRWRNEQIDKAMTAMGIAQNLKEEEEGVVVARGGGSKSVQVGLAQAGRQGILAGDSKAEVQHLQPLYLEYVLRQREGNANCRSLERVAHGQFYKAKVDFKFKGNVFQATMQGALLSGMCVLAGQHGSFTENEVFPLESRLNELARRLLAMTRRNWDSDPKKKEIHTKELHRKLGIVPIAMELRIGRPRLSPNSDRTNPKGRPALLQDKNGNLTENEIFLLEACQNTRLHDRPKLISGRTAAAPKPLCNFLDHGAERNTWRCTRCGFNS